jgi:hypothetical protein
MRRVKTSGVVCRVCIVWVCVAALTTVAVGQSAEEKTAEYLESVRHQPGLLLAFLQQMPKGGDLHVHLSGAV